MGRQLDLFQQDRIETSEGLTDYITYTIKGVRYGFPVMTQSKECALEDAEDIMYSEIPLTAARKKATAKLLAAVDEDKKPLFTKNEIDSFIDKKFSEVYQQAYYNIANEVKLNKKIETAITFLNKHRIALISGQENIVTIRSFADKALCDGASYARVIAWIPKLKKCKDLAEYEASIVDFYNKYELYYEETI